MTPNLYTKEFRAFKYLKSSFQQVEYFKRSLEEVNRIQPWTSEPDPDFSWPYRLEFIEQLLDLRYNSVYIVTATSFSSSDMNFSRMMELRHPIIIDRNPIIYSSTKIITEEDIPAVESNSGLYCLVSDDAFIKEKDRRMFNVEGDPLVFRMNSFPISPFSKTTFTELFADKDSAAKYAQAINDYLRNSINAVSTISKLL